MKKIEFCNNKNIISEKLKSARKAKRISQSELAAKMQTYNINIDQQMISKIEKNARQVTDYEFACICKCLNVSPEWMLQDFESYKKAHEKINLAYKNKNEWAKSMIINIANSGKFSSDRTIKEYAKEIWNLKAVSIK